VPNCTTLENETQEDKFCQVQRLLNIAIVTR